MKAAKLSTVIHHRYSTDQAVQTCPLFPGCTHPIPSDRGTEEKQGGNRAPAKLILFY